MGRHIRDMQGAMAAARPDTAFGIAATARLATRRGFAAASDLCPGDAVLTRDGGYRPVRRILPLGLLPCVELAGSGLWLRPGHGVIGRDATGAEMLIPARRFGDTTPRLVRRLVLALGFDRHEILCADGGWVESQPGGAESARPRALAAPQAAAMRKFRVAGGGLQS